MGVDMEQGIVGIKIASAYSRTALSTVENENDN